MHWQWRRGACRREDVLDLVRGREVVILGAPVDEVVSHLGYPVYILLFLGVWKVPPDRVLA